MPYYRRANVAGGTYFFTVVTYRRRPFLIDNDVRRALREGIALVGHAESNVTLSRPIK